MKKTAITIAAAALIVLTVSGRTVRRTLSIFQSNVPETEILANETMEFVYEYKWCVDTVETHDEKTDRMLLQIAPGGLSKFSSYKNLSVDSLLMRLSREQVAEAALEGKLSNGEPMTIYKNFPAGHLTHTEKICQDWFRYEEEMPQFDWELTDSMTIVLGYECREARCSFRGREWSAFYCEEIPVPDGPWKLSGLPGLIMKAGDENGEYIFECIGINSSATRPVTIYKVPFTMTDRRGYYDAKNRYDVNPYAYYEATTGGSITVADEAGNIRLDAFDPMELTYDYIERDWKK